MMGEFAGADVGHSGNSGVIDTGSSVKEKKKYEREFLLNLQFVPASLQKPKCLNDLSDIVLDKPNMNPLHRPGRHDFIPPFANLSRSSTGRSEARLSQTERRYIRIEPLESPQPRKIISGMPLSDVKLNKAENAWRPSMKKSCQAAGREAEKDRETQDLLKKFRSILNKLTPEKFNQLMKRVTDLNINSEEKLKGVIDLMFEKAISEPNFSVAYARMCHHLKAIEVQKADKPGQKVKFSALLLVQCQKEFQTDKNHNQLVLQKQKELEEASGELEKQLLTEELEEAKDKARRRSLGNVRFIGELFNLRMLNDVIMHDCIIKLLRTPDDEFLECLCKLLSTIGKNLDADNDQTHMDKYFYQMKTIVKERRTSTRIRFMLQDVLDLRQNNWVPRRGDQGPKTLDQIHKEAELEKQMEQVKVHQSTFFKREMSGSPEGRMVRAGPGVGGGSYSPRDSIWRQDERWKPVPNLRKQAVDIPHLSNGTKRPLRDYHRSLVLGEGVGARLNWCKGNASDVVESGLDSLGRPLVTSIYRASTGRQLYSPCEHSDHGSDLRSDSEGDQLRVHRYSVIREYEHRQQPRRHTRSADSVNGEEDGAECQRSREHSRNGHKTATSPPPVTNLKNKSTAIIQEYLTINDLKEALTCVQELNCPQLLFVFVQTGLDYTLEKSPKAREDMGLLLLHLIKNQTLQTQQYYKGLHHILEMVEDLVIDIPHIWLYLAELIRPMVQEGVVPMGALFREISKCLTPSGKADKLLVPILELLCRHMGQDSVKTMWREAGLQWTDFLPKEVTVKTFVKERNLEFTLEDDSQKKKRLNDAEITSQLSLLLQEEADNQNISSWIQMNVEEQQMASDMFARVLTTCVCQSAITFKTVFKVSARQIHRRAKLLQKFLTDERKQLQALFALQALMVQMDHPAYLLRMFFDTLLDEDLITEETFFSWESSKDPAEMLGRQPALHSVAGFFTWLRDVEDFII
ncbi:eukaryotic translation initiation factor 4 gamma 1-like isoform X1 [Synchiropus splendidus]|uniref:eukaryotic translation initiation factor 4 gamma 1-like isoform X1 n=2 Tax=Synchiropus splendidus TaxID=270530 RepID=UPI00237E7309|nr:eukaryotic translation initiation factor 4 gamma 1-like isoform X1 [Synchiropus splendidus]